MVAVNRHFQELNSLPVDALTLIRLILAKKRLIFLFSGVCLISAYLFGLFVVSYEAQGQLIIRPIGARSLNPEEWSILGMVYSPYPENVRQQGVSYISILRSRDVIGRVVDQLGLHKRYEAQSHAIIDAIKQPFRLLFYGRLPAVTYTPREKAIEKTRKSIQAVLISGSSVIQISAKNRDAAKVSDIVNALMDSAVAYSVERNALAAMKTTQLMEAEIEAIRKKQVESIGELEALRTAHGIKSTGTTAEQISELSRRINAIESRLDQHNSDLTIAEHRVVELRKHITAIPEHKLWTYRIDNSTALQVLRQTLLNQNLELINEQIDFQSGSPQITARKAQIAATEQAIKDELANIMPIESYQAISNRQQLAIDLVNTEIEAASLPIGIEKLQQQIGQLNEKASELNKVHENLNSLENEIDVLKGAEIKTQLVLNNARTIQNLDLTEFSILSRAIIPRYPSINEISLAFFVFFAAFVGGFIAIFYILGSAKNPPD